MADKTVTFEDQRGPYRKMVDNLAGDDFLVSLDAVRFLADALDHAVQRIDALEKEKSYG